MATDRPKDKVISTLQKVLLNCLPENLYLLPYLITLLLVDASGNLRLEQLRL